MRRDMELARMTAYYSSLIHASKRIRLADFGVFPWEDASDFMPKFAPIDKEAFDRLSALEF